jgi:hypothetical protein
MTGFRGQFLSGTGTAFRAGAVLMGHDIDLIQAQADLLDTGCLFIRFRGDIRNQNRNLR